MKTGMIAAFAGLAVSGVASAAFTGYNVVATNTTNSGQNLTRYEVFAVFNGSTDTVLNVFNLSVVSVVGGGDGYGGFWHKDNNDSSPGVLSQTFGTWAPQLIGSATANRPFDSFMCIGATVGATSTANADPSWTSGGSGAHAGGAAGWNRPDLVNNGTIGWFNSSPPNLQGRVGVNSNSATEVKVAQFVLSQGHAARTYSLRTAYNNAGTSSPTFADAQFSLGVVPAPGAIALLGLAGLAGRRRR